MFDRKKSEAAVDFLAEKFNPLFIYFADHLMSENIFDIAYYSEEIADEYTICLMEDELSSMLGVPVEINNLKECDTEFAGSILSDGETVYCISEIERSRYLTRIAHEFEKIRIDRAILINRMNECASIYEQ